MPRHPIESVRRVLDENPNMPDSVKRYFQAVRDGKLPSYYRGELERLKNNYSDETPPVDVRKLISDPKKLTKYKCQGNYIVGLCHTLEGVVEDKVITDRKTLRAIGRLLGSNLNFQVGDPTNERKITKINRVISKVLRKLG